MSDSRGLEVNPFVLLFSSVQRGFPCTCGCNKPFCFRCLSYPLIYLAPPFTIGVNDIKTVLFFKAHSSYNDCAVKITLKTCFKSRLAWSKKCPRQSGSLPNTPVKRVVSIVTLSLGKPRVVIHWCWAPIRTVTPFGFKAVWIHLTTWLEEFFLGITATTLMAKLQIKAEH